MMAFTSIEAPKANPERLLDIVREAHNGKVVVPEFQRSFVWTKEDIEELLVSILLGYFVGTFLMLDTPPQSSLFPFRPVEGLNLVNPDATPRSHATVRLVLDGQQRITSVFYALYEPAIPLKNASYPHRFYLRLDEALEGRIEEAVVGVSTRDQRRMSEMESLAATYRVLRFRDLRDWESFYAWLEQRPDPTERKQLYALSERLAQFMVPVVALSPDMGPDNIVNIFERINRTGVSLSLFDLAGAQLYHRGVRLRDLWDAFEDREPEVAKAVRPESVLRVVAVLEGKEPRKGNLLDVIDKLDKSQFESRWQEATEALVAARRRISRHYGALTDDWVPYSTMIVPLAAMLHELQRDRAGEEAHRKLDRWYWGSVFSQRYDSAVDTKSYQDVRDLRRWVNGGEAPEWLARLSVHDVDLDVAESRSAIYRGLMCTIVRQGALDFLTGQSAVLSECQDDHIFPKSIYRMYDSVNSILNRTLISKTSNNRKRDKKPSDFMHNCLEQHGGDEQQLLRTLASHFICEEGYLALLDNDFDAFISARRKMFERAVESLLSEGTLDVASPV